MLALVKIGMKLNLGNIIVENIMNIGETYKRI